MSIFGPLSSAYYALFSISKADSEALAADLSKFPGAKRAALDIINTINGVVHDEFMALPNPPAALYTRMDDLREQGLANWQAAINLESTIAGIFREVRASGSVSDDDFNSAMRAMGLEEADLGALPVVAIGVIIVAAVAIWKGPDYIRAVVDSVGEQMRKNETLRVMIGSVRQVMEDWRQRLQSDPSAPPPKIPDTWVPPPSTGGSVASTALSLGTLAVVGVGLFAAAKIFGGRRK